MASDIQLLVGYLEQTLSPDRKVGVAAERYLESIESSPNYPLLLLTVIETPNISQVARMAAAITFKNYIKRNWKVDEESDDKIAINDRNMIRSSIVGLMLKSEEHIQRQLSDAISIIGREDFPLRWPNLLGEMVSRMQTSGGDFSIINGILRTAHSLFKRYRHEFKSDSLWTEIKLVLETFAKPFTDLFVGTVGLAETHASNPVALKIIFSSLVLCVKIFNSLNSQDLPEFFEDNLQIWMSHFLNLLSVSPSCLKTDDEDEPGLLEELKSEICENISMYAQKYHEEFNPYLKSFVQKVWELLTSLGLETKYDLLVSNSIRFLSTIVDRPQNKELFQDRTAMDSLCSKVIIPNMQFRQSDEEMFQDNPEEYIRRDIEGSDLDTRRRAACDLVKSLSRHFEAEITTIFSDYINRMLTDFASNPNQFWKSKDAAIYLVTALSVKGSTFRTGTTHTSKLVNIVEFYKNFVHRDLEGTDVNVLPVLRADALKYLMVFRNQLPLEEIVIPSFPLIIAHLNAQNPVIHSYAAHALERMMMMREEAQNVAKIKVSHIQNLIQPLLAGLFNVFSLPGSSENEYAMKAIMRTLSLLQDHVVPYFPEILPKLTCKLQEISKNPSKPNFNHYLFESLSICIRVGTRMKSDSLSEYEAILFPVFQQLMVQDVQEFIPYVFQIFSLLLESHQPSIPVPNSYMELFPCLLAPQLWDRPGNVHPLVRLLRDFVERGINQIIASGKLEPLLGVFQKLIASKSNDHEGFYLLQTLIEYLPQDKVDQYIEQIFRLLFQRLTGSKTTKYVRSLLVFFSLFAHKFQATALVTVIDRIQANMFGMVVERLLVAEVQRVTGKLERKICAVGITDILTTVPQMIDGPYAPYFGPMLQALIALFELPEDETVPEDEHFIEIEDTPGYQASYAKLVFASKQEPDPFEGSIPDAKIYLAQKLKDLSDRFPGRIPTLISTIQPEAVTHLQQYLTAANVTLA
ncbi:chromosome segregation 1 [Brevipalpus obovatus]|uniref:chromosome segregation 1 n=1 Tax=Brevipalpus obovatus TaxID=246614 RepID=UPI003D9E4C35